MLSEQTVGAPLEELEPVATAQELIGLIEEAQAVFVEESLHRYVVTLLRQTRNDPRIYLGGSPRAGIALMRVAKARALARSRDYLLPDDVKEVAAHVLSHRLILAPEARSSGSPARTWSPRSSRRPRSPSSAARDARQARAGARRRAVPRRLGIRRRAALPGRGRPRARRAGSRARGSSSRRGRCG